MLEGALADFDGTTLTISHDRYFLDRTCTRILELADGEVTEYFGGYSDYLAEKERRKEVARLAEEEAARQRAAAAAQRARTPLAKGRRRG